MPDRIQGFFRIPFDEMSAVHLLIKRVSELNMSNLTIVATGLGFAKRARNFAEMLEAPLAIIENRHHFGYSLERQKRLLGDVEGKTCVIIDDEVSTGATMVGATELLVEHGAARIFGACIHPILAPGAVTRLKNSAMESLITTDSLPPPPDEPWDGLDIITVGPLLGEVIQRIHKGISVAAMFAEGHHQLGRW